MNERIKQLAAQANWYKPNGLPSDWDDEDYIVSPEDMRKFAELILRECCTICDSFSEDCSPSTPTETHSDAIKEHFGIE